MWAYTQLLKNKYMLQFHDLQLVNDLYDTELHFNNLRTLDKAMRYIGYKKDLKGQHLYFPIRYKKGG